MEISLNRVIGTRINAALAKEGMSQKALAEALGLPQTNTVSYWVSGKRTPNREQLLKIAKLLNVTMDYLFGLSESTKKENDPQRVSVDYVGLSESAVEELHTISTSDPSDGVVNDIFYLLNDMIEEMPLSLKGDYLLLLLSSYYSQFPQDFDIYELLLREVDSEIIKIESCLPSTEMNLDIDRLQENINIIHSSNILNPDFYRMTLLSRIGDAIEKLKKKNHHNSPQLSLFDESNKRGSDGND